MGELTTFFLIWIRGGGRVKERGGGVITYYCNLLPHTLSLCSCVHCQTSLFIPGHWICLVNSGIMGSSAASNAIILVDHACNFYAAWRA